MNPHQNANQNPASTSAAQQVNPVINQPMFNGNVGGLFPNNMPVVAPPCFMNFPNQAFPLQSPMGQFPNGFNPQQNFIPFPVNQFNSSQQQPGQFLVHNSMNPIGEQVLLQNTIQNIYQLLQLQNTQGQSGNFPMFPNQMVNVMAQQYPAFPMNQQFGMPTSNGPHANHGAQNIGQQLQGSPFLSGSSGNTPMIQNQMFGMPNFSNPIQNVNQGPPVLVSSMTDANAPRQMVNTVQTPTLTSSEENHKTRPTNVSGGWTGSQHKNFTGHKTHETSHKGFKSQQRRNEKFGNYKGNTTKGGSNNLAVDSISQNSSKFEKKIPSLSYTEQEIKEWREARKKNYPTDNQQTASDVAKQEAILRCQQLKEILAKQAELGCEVADIPPSYLTGPDKQSPRERKHERQRHQKKGKFHNKRGRSFHDEDRMGKKTKAKRPGNVQRQ